MEMGSWPILIQDHKRCLDSDDPPEVAGSSEVSKGTENKFDIFYALKPSKYIYRCKHIILKYLPKN